MHNDDQRAIEGPQPEERFSTVYTSDSARSRRRKQTAVAVAGLAVFLSAGGVVAQHLLDTDEATITGAGTLAPLDLDTMPTTASAGARRPFVAPSIEAPVRSAERVTPARRPPSPAPSSLEPATRQRTASPEPSTTAERIKVAREQAAKDRFPVQRPLPAASTIAPDGEIRVTQTGSLRTDKRTLKVVSAWQDLTGYGELGLVADGGEPVGSAYCSQMFRTSPDAPARRRPTLLVCWRTSATRSVYTVAVDLGGHPSTQVSVAQIDRIWPTLA